MDYVSAAGHGVTTQAAPFHGRRMPSWHRLMPAETKEMYVTTAVCNILLECLHHIYMLKSVSKTWYFQGWSSGLSQLCEPLSSQEASPHTFHSVCSFPKLNWIQLKFVIPQSSDNSIVPVFFLKLSPFVHLWAVLSVFAENGTSAKLFCPAP